MADTTYLKVPDWYKSFIVIKSENLPSTTDPVKYKALIRDTLFLQTIEELKNINAVSCAKKAAAYVEHYTLRWDDFERAERLLEGQLVRPVEELRSRRMDDLVRRLAMASMYSDHHGVDEDVFKAYYEARISYLKNFRNTYHQDNSLPGLQNPLAQAWKAVGFTQ